MTSHRKGTEPPGPSSVVTLSDQPDHLGSKGSRNDKFNEVKAKKVDYI